MGFAKLPVRIQQLGWIKKQNKPDELKKMFRNLTLFLLEAIKRNGAASVFWAGVIEQIISPIPSILIPMSAGFLLIPQGVFSGLVLRQILQKISLPYALGATLGSSLLYLTAFFGGRILIEKYGKFFGLSLKQIDKFRIKFTRGFKDEVLIFLLLVLPVTPISIVAVSCGLIGITIWEFYPLMFLGTLTRSILLACLGWKTGETYTQIAGSLDKTESFLSLGAIGVAFLGLAFLYYKRHKFFS